MHRTCLAFLFLLVFSKTALAQLPDAAVDVRHYGFVIQLNDENNTIKGEATIDVRYLKNSDTFSLNLVRANKSGKGMLVSAVTEMGNPVKFEQDSDNVVIYAPAKRSESHSYTITYSGVPSDGLIISNNMFGHRTFFGDNWPNRAHNWLPCVDHPADKATVDFTVTAPDHYQVVANGAKVSETQLPGYLKLTHYKESAPVSTKVMVIGVAEFAIDHPGDVGATHVYTYVFNENKVRGFQDYAVARPILQYYVNNIGPFSYEKLANVQSKTIFGGMENASCIFYFEQSVGDKGIESLMAHEIAHQWFGDAASEKSWAHLWLSEGFATYFTDLYLEHRYGVDTLMKTLQTQRRKIIAFARRRFTPVIDTAVTKNFTQLLNANSYEKGGWVLHMLRRKLGDEIFWRSIRAYYNVYRDKNANTDDLRHVFEINSGLNLQTFFNQWLRTPGHPKLKINYEYDAAAKMLNVHVEQTQEYVFNFPLEFSVPGTPKVFSFNINGKTKDIQIPLSEKPSMLNIDPNINLLFEQVN
ncbi:peptidase M1 [Mucilaginibacter sp. PPCGB 2223]|uniref:M1 family metallopeptidase n=1 Tax=Mucilaginibacter sp. PPCGB 2223 TaxID=1886027 RepID=UPI000826A208|nr:M1 family metallopeptidase [Mucilaginibacter sp. PPCGB 2223]OCX52966.1 peptidase M1 [Mucilaginibacter sp. PPCGB 2223]